MKYFSKRYVRLFLGGVAYLLARSIGKSLRIEVRGTENLKQGSGVIFVGWHGKSFVPANFFSGKGVWALFSLSNDGEIQSRIFRRFGFRVIRGSTGRGGTRALIESIRVLREGDQIAITPDGPRGPAKVIQQGVMLMAQKSGAALVPVGSASKPCSNLSTWDNYMVPWFFARSALVFGEAQFVAEDASDAEVEAVRLKLRDAIEVAEREAEKLCGSVPSIPAATDKAIDSKKGSE